MSEQEYERAYQEIRSREIEQLRAELAAAREERDGLAATVEQARAILFASSDNEITAHPWWAVVRNGSFGHMVMLDGPFFSRERAEELMEARRHEYGAKAYVFCYSGNRSQHYRDLRAALSANPSATLDSLKARLRAEVLAGAVWTGYVMDRGGITEFRWRPAPDFIPVALIQLKEGE